MTTVTSPMDAPRLGFFGRLKAFADNIFEPKLHTLFAAFWSLSLLGNLHVVSGVRVWHIDLTLLVLVLSVFVCLFFLRMIDEVKDYDYDVVHNPGRPLVSGLVTRGDIARYVTLFAIVVLTLNALLAIPLAIWLALDMLYGLFQLPLEKRSRAVRENLFVNLVAVYPVNVGLSVYTVLFFLQRSGAPFEWRHALLVVAYACAFLHFELARKSGWPHMAVPGERLYSQIVGLPGSLAMATIFGLGAIGSALRLFAPWAQSGTGAVTGWLPLLPLLPMSAGLFLFARNRTKRHAARPPAVAFLFTFYVAMLAHALATRALVLGQG
jgi:hypothetical protein